MPKTLAEKILAKVAGVKEVKPGEIIEASVDLVMIHDLTGPLALKVMRDIGIERVWDPERLIVILDHQAPADRVESANLQKQLREFVRKHQVKWFYDVGAGICHQVLAESGLVKPGQLIIGADSHTCTLGALGAFATGVGSTDAAAAILTGKSWLKVPESMKIIVNGTLQDMVTPKDVILKIIGDLKADGANYMAIEFTGKAISKMSISSRMTICNMSVEMGAKAGMVAADDVTIDYLRSLGMGEVFPLKPDAEAEYVKEIEYDISNLEPMVSIPPRVDNVKPVSEIEGIEVDQVFIGSCTNGRLEDLELAARILRKRRVKRGVRCIIIPASKRIYEKAIELGLITEFLRAGCVVCPPTCGPCLGGHMGVLGDFEVAASTSNRNFIGRMGSKTSKVYLMSPATAAATAIKGEITDPRRMRLNP